MSILDEAVKQELAPDKLFKDVICFGWYDGPLSGILAFRDDPSEYRFDLVDDAQAFDYRVFTIAPLPIGTIEQFRNLVRQRGNSCPTPGPIWCPTWHFPSSDAEAVVERLLQQSVSPVAAFCWNLVENKIVACRAIEGETKQGDWFSWLGLVRPTDVDDEADSR